MTKKHRTSQNLPARVTSRSVDHAIVRLRGCNVILDANLARLYGVTTKALIQATKRNRERFPHDFMFELTVVEFEHLRSQTVTSSTWGGRRTRPFAFTEQGVAMLSGVLRSPKAIKVNIEIMRAFVRLRRMLESHMDLARKIKSLEAKYDSQFAVVFEAIRELMAPRARPTKPIGFER